MSVRPSGSGHAFLVLRQCAVSGLGFPAHGRSLFAVVSAPRFGAACACRRTLAPELDVSTRDLPAPAHTQRKNSLHGAEKESREGGPSGFPCPPGCGDVISGNQPSASPGLPNREVLVLLGPSAICEFNQPSRPSSEEKSSLSASAEGSTGVPGGSSRAATSSSRVFGSAAGTPAVTRPLSTSSGSSTAPSGTAASSSTGMPPSRTCRPACHSRPLGTGRVEHFTSTFTRIRRREDDGVHHRRQ